MELQRLVMPPLRRQAQGGEGGPVEQPLVGQVVDGEHRGRTFGLQRQQGGDQAGLPVVGMQDIGAPAEPGPVTGDLHQGAGEDGEAPGIVRPVMAVGADVGVAGAVEAGRGIHQPDLDLSVGQAGFQQAYLFTGAGDLEGGDGPGVVHFLQHAAIGGQHQPQVVAQVAERPRQGAGHVGQAARLDQGVGLAGGEQDLHGDEACGRSSDPSSGVPSQ